MVEEAELVIHFHGHDIFRVGRLSFIPFEVKICQNSLNFLLIFLYFSIIYPYFYYFLLILGRTWLNNALRNTRFDLGNKKHIFLRFLFLLHLRSKSLTIPTRRKFELCLPLELPLKSKHDWISSPFNPRHGLVYQWLRGWPASPNHTYQQTES
jgi:hypothetical protein